MAGTHVSVDVPTPTPVWDPGQQRMVPFPQVPTSAVNSSWLQQHVPCPAKGQLMTSLLLVQTGAAGPASADASQHCPCGRYGPASPGNFLRGRGG